MTREKSKARQIVVVDDDPAVLSTLVNVLKTWGYDLVSFTRFEDARAFLSEKAADILIVDVRLGTYNGLQLVHLARQNHPKPEPRLELHPRLKGLFATGYARDVIVHHGRLDPGVQLITKPFAFEDLAVRLRSVLDGQDSSRYAN